LRAQLRIRFAAEIKANHTEFPLLIDVTSILNKALQTQPARIVKTRTFTLIFVHAD